ncbi:MAG: restriction endonuclease subunit S, partial [Bacteroidales bacterium]|nr:restriction endonuclease subunit S [Bacteroidales bacterium]
ILSTYDALIQNYKRQIAALQSAASELYKEWFVRFRFPGYKNAKFDNGLPEGWKVERVKNCVNRLPFGQTYKKDELESKGKVIVIDQSEDEYLGFHNYEPSHKASAENPIALFGDHSCKYQLMIKNFSLGENIIPYTAKNVDLYYLYFAVYKIVQTEEYKRHWSLFVNKKILIPNKDLQMKFRDFIIPLFKKIENLQQQITNLTTQRDLLLPRLMSGKLSVE